MSVFRDNAIAFCCWRLIQEDSSVNRMDLANLLGIDPSTISRAISRKPFWLTHRKNLRNSQTEFKRIKALQPRAPRHTS